jgi:signal transduction histidine kinase
MNPEPDFASDGLQTIVKLCMWGCHRSQSRSCSSWHAWSKRCVREKSSRWGTVEPEAHTRWHGDDDAKGARRREHVLFELAKRNKADVAETFRAITEATAVALDVERTSIWRLLPDGNGIVSQDDFVRAQGRHTAGDILWAREYPTYFSAIAQCRVIAAHDARIDIRTRELSKAYLEVHGITSMMDVPIWHKGRLYGVLCHEHIGPLRRWTSDDETFAANLADVASLALEAGERRKAEWRWDAVLNTIQEAVFVLDDEGTIVHANPLGARMIERAGGGVTLAERMELVEFRDEQGRPIPADRTGGRRSLSGEIVRGEINHLVFKRTGERRSFRITSAPMRDGDRIHSVVVVLADVTEEVSFDRLKREVLAALAHEFKTPVAIVKGYAQHMSRRPDTSPAQHPMLAAIDRAANRLQRLIDDLVEVSGISLGRLVLRREPVEITAVLRAVVRWAAPAASRHHLVVNVPENVVVSGDRSRLEQAVRRLVDNAIRYSPAGGDVDIDVAPSDKDVVISVRDRGIGIPADQQSRIFELFFRAHAGTPHDIGGLGIGLFMAREIAIRHGGMMWFESEEGKGSTFSMRLPRAEAA